MPSWRRRALGLTLLALAPPLVLAEEDGAGAAVRFERLGSEHGLSHNTVYAILQDARGFMWFGTQDGLDRYDGVAFTTYRHDPADDSSLASNWVSALAEDRDQRLWVGSRAGLQQVRPDGRFEHVSLPVSDGAPTAVLALAADATGRMWVGTRTGLFRVDPSGSVAAVELTAPDGSPLAVSTIYALRTAPDGEVWGVSDMNGAFTLSCVSRVGIAPRSVPPAWALAFTPSGQLIDQIRVPGDGLVTALLPDSHGRLWVGTFAGLFEGDRDGGALRRVPTDQLRPGSLTSEINTIVEDRAGAVWFGTFGGVLRVDPYAKAFNHLAHVPGDADTLAADAVSAIVEASPGRLWVGTYGAGLDEVDLNRRVARHHRQRAGDPRSLCGDYIWDLAPSRRLHPGVWVSTTSGLCLWRDGRSELHQVVEECRNPFTLVEDAAGTVWLGAVAGLCRFDPSSGRSERVRVAGRTIPRVDTLHVDDDGRVWMGSSEALPALAMFDPRDGRYVEYPRAVTSGVWDIEADSGPRLWLATGTGLVGFDPASGGATPLPTAGPGAVHYSVARDGAGVLWAGTNKGLSRYDPASGFADHYDRAEGTGNIEYNRHAVAAGAGGDLFFGGMHGLTWFSPAALVRNPHPPPVAITAVRLLGRSGERVILPPPGAAIDVDPGATAITFEYTALSFTQSQRNRFRYRLDGFDASWIDAGTSRSARYTNLPPGRFTMRVIAANNDGVWNEAGVALPVVVAPSLTQTWWFRAGLVAGVLAAFAIAYRIRVRRLLEIERLRLRIASDLHDELGSDVSGLALTSSLVGRSDGLGERDRERLAAISATASRVLDGLRDIVWHINPEHDTLSSLDQRLKSVAATQLAGIAHEVTTSGMVFGAVPMEVRRHVLLIFKETLHNIVRHASATRVRIEVVHGAGRLQLTVEDNGRGLSGGPSTDGSGLSSMRRRAGSLGGSVAVEPAPGGGTRVTLSVPLFGDRQPAPPR